MDVISGRCVIDCLLHLLLDLEFVLVDPKPLWDEDLFLRDANGSLEGLKVFGFLSASP